MRHDRTIYSILLLALVSVLLLVLAYQIPAVQQVDIGGFDAAYVNGFYEPERIDAPNASTYLNGSDGSARWSRGESALLFPQAGLPAQLTLRMRGHPAASASEPTEVTVIVNGIPTAQIALTSAWSEQTVSISGGLTKPEDVLITLRTAPRVLGANDARAVGVLVDRATFVVGPFPIWPYPLQVMYAACIGGLLALLWVGQAGTARTSQDSAGALRLPVGLYLLVGMLALLFLFFYRMQPLYPWPLRGMLPAFVIGLTGLLAIQQVEFLRRLYWLPNVVALSGIVGWVAVVLVAGQEHLVLSVPGVEKDFRVFATRDSLGAIFAADGFYNLGYPLLLWLIMPLAQGNAFLAARLIAALSGGLLLLAAWVLARSMLGAPNALVALFILALSPFVVQYSLYIGSDMPFAALCGWTLVVFEELRRPCAQRQRYRLLCVAGMLAGLAFLVRHPGLLLLPLGYLVLLLTPHIRQRGSFAILTLAFVVVIAPQLVVNLRDTGQLFYSQQAKNIWLAVFGGGDWGRWGEAHNDVALAAVIAQDPARFWANFMGNLRAFAGSGAEDSSEFGRAIQLRLLGFPANWLAVAGLLGWAWSIMRSISLQPCAVRRPHHVDEQTHIPLTVLVWLGLYVPAIAIGFALTRFFLPITIGYAVAGAWALGWLSKRLGSRRSHLVLSLVLFGLLWGGFAAGTTYVVRPVPVGSDTPGQPEESLQVARLVLNTLQAGERVIVRVPATDEAGLALAKYSAISHLVLPAPRTDAPAAYQTSQATLLVWSDRLGPAPVIGALVGQIGSYRILRIGD